MRLLTDPDAVIKVSAALAGQRDGLTPVALIDIDEAAHAAWGSPVTIPRRELLQLVEGAFAASASAVVVDVDLARSSMAEQNLVAEALRAHAAAPDRLRPPLFLVRDLRPATQQQRRAPDITSTSPSHLDALLEASANIRWVSVLFEGEADWHYRTWHGAHVACNGTPRGFASVGLATAAVHAQSMVGLRRLDEWLQALAAARCAGRPAPPAPEDAPWLRNASARMPIPFLLGHTTETAQFAYTRGQSGTATPVFVRFAALDILAQGGLAPRALEGRVAIIGASFWDSRDHYRTPLGTMPGFYILANIISNSNQTLSEQTMGGFRGYLLGLPLFALHLLAIRALRKAAAIVAVFAATCLATLAGLSLGLSPYVIHEAALTSLVMISLFAIMEKLVGTFEPGARSDQTSVPLLLRAVLSDRALKAFASRMKAKQ